MKNFKLLWLLAAACSLTFASCSKDETPDTSATITFESAVLPAAGYINNVSYIESGVTFNNTYDATSQYAAAFSVSKLHDKTTPGYENQYSVYNNGGAAGSANFGVCYYSEYSTTSTGQNDAYFAFATGVEKKMLSVMVCNGTYAALAVSEGNVGPFGGVKKFVAGDWFKLTMTGFNAAGTKTGAVDYYLADYRDGKTYICTDWTNVDLSPLGKVNKVEFTFSSTDSDPQFGMNTPSYVCIDNVKFDNAAAAQ